MSVHKSDTLGGGLSGGACLWEEYSGWHLEKCGSSAATAATMGQDKVTLVPACDDFLRNIFIYSVLCD